MATIMERHAAMLGKVLASILNILAQYIKGNGKMDLKRGKECKNKQKERIMMGNFIMVIKVEMASARMLMAVYIKDNGRKAKDRAQEHPSIAKGKTMSDNGRTICRRDMES